MLQTSARLLKLLSLLQSRPAWTGPELAGRLEVSTRTVRTDIARLRALGYPVDATAGPAGHYRMGSGAAMPPLLLDDDEAVAVALGLRAVSTSPLARVAETSALALAKVEQLLPGRLRRQVSALARATTQVADDAGIPDRDPVVDPAVLAEIAAAVRDHQCLRLDYPDRDDVGGVLVEPYRLVSWERRWYLLGFVPGRSLPTGRGEAGAWRVFRVERMTLRPATGRTFGPREPPDPDVSAYVMRWVAYDGWNVHARVVVRAPAAEVRARINPAVGIVEPLAADRCVLITGADSINTLAVYIALLDLDLEVTEPPELVDRFRILARRYAAAVATVAGAGGPAPSGDRAG